ncbi:MAG: M6 family metalloprotease domain-containing protein, partial [Desulfuromonadales bacterium]
MAHRLSRIVQLLIMLVTLAHAGLALAMPALREIGTLKQPDGLQFNARMWGDEHNHGWETESGHSIIHDPVTDVWYYADLDGSGKMQPTRLAVGRDNAPPKALGLKPALRQNAPKNNSFSQKRVIPSRVRESGAARVPSSTQGLPVILVNFNNTTFTYSRNAFDSLLFGTGTKSLKDYYYEVSYGKFTVTGAVAGPYNASHPHDYYGTNDSNGDDMYPATLVIEAVTAADNAGFDFSLYDTSGTCYVDAISIVHQGTGEESGTYGKATDIWSHSWDLASAKGYGDGSGEYTTKSICKANPSQKVKVNNYVIQPEQLKAGTMVTIGVFTHEFGHALGLPDLYDTTDKSEGAGDWTLMAGGSWLGVTNAGDTPPHLDPWSKLYLGWITPTVVAGTLSNETIQQVSSLGDVYQLGSGTSTSGEYWLVENRQKSGFDAGLPGSGLLVWHIDGNAVNDRLSTNSVNNYRCWPGSTPACSTQHQGVGVVQADGLYELEKNLNRGNSSDPFPGSKNNTSLTDTTVPDMKLYSGTSSGFSITSISVSAAIMTANLSTSGVSASYSVTISKSGTGSGTVTSSPTGISCGATCSASYNSGTSVT